MKRWIQQDRFDLQYNHVLGAQNVIKLLQTSIITLMKPQHSKQNSLDIKATSSLNSQAYIHSTTETIAKTYRKRTNNSESNPLLSLHNAPSVLGKHSFTRQVKKSLGKTVQHRSNQKKSQPKLTNEKSIERLKLIYKPNEGHTLGTKSKLSKIVNALTLKPNRNGKDILQQFYQAKNVFEALIQEWRRLEIYDDIDDLVVKLVDNYSNLVQEVAIKAYSFANQCISKYQKEISLLEAQNQNLKKVLQIQSNKFEVQMMEAQNRLYEQYEKAQWSTFIYNQIEKKNFDLQRFVKGSEVYAKAKAEYMSKQLYKFYTSAHVQKQKHQKAKKQTKINNES